jgi:hypothetical protein
MTYEEFLKEYKVDYKFFDYFFEFKDNALSVGVLISDDILSVLLKNISKYSKEDLRKLSSIITYFNYIEYKNSFTDVYKLKYAFYSHEILLSYLLAVDQIKLKEFLKKEGFVNVIIEDLFLVLLISRLGQFFLTIDLLIKPENYSESKKEVSNQNKFWNYAIKVSIVTSSYQGVVELFQY